jgi:protein disulfide-isomerase-like protein
VETTLLASLHGMRALAAVTAFAFHLEMQTASMYLCPTAFSLNMLRFLQQLVLRALISFAVVLMLSMCAASAAEIVELTPDNIDQYIPHNNKSVFVYFYASWCGHCINFAPEFAAAAESFTSQSDKVIFAKSDADTHASLKGKFGVNGYPTIKLYIAGEMDLNSHRSFYGSRNKAGVIEWLNSILGTSVDPSRKATMKSKTLIDAIFEHDVDGLLELIKANNASVNEVREGAPAIVWAAELGHKDIVTILAENGADYGWDPACLIGDIEQVERLLAKGIDVNYKEPYYGTTCLMLAAEKNYAELVTFLVKRGAAVDASNKNGNTALIKAAEFGQMKALRALVEAGASMTSRNIAGKTARDVAADEQKTEAKEYLERQLHVHRVEPVSTEHVMDSDKHDLPAQPHSGTKNEL